MLLALISAGFAGEAAAAAGRVDFATSGVTVAGRDGQQRPLARGAELDSGDTIRTGNQGRAQIRFTDGSYVSLQPNTDFAISDYKYDGQTDGSERGFYGLVRGAMRTVTGAIGRVNRNAYRVTTPTATVGIRGTGGVIQVLNDGSTLVIGTSGIWSLTNPAGSIDVPAGVSGLAPSEPNTPPRESNTQPQTSTAPVQPEQPGYVQGDQVNPDGTADITTITPLVSGPGYAPALGVSGSVMGGDGGEGGIIGTAVFDPQGRLIELDIGEVFKLAPGGVHAEFGTDGILAWGRWTGTITNSLVFCEAPVCTETLAEDQGFHYVIGKPTPVMPTTGTARYELFTGANGLTSATSPTWTFTGTGAPGTLNSARLDVTFGASHSIAGTFNVTMPGVSTYNWTSSTSTPSAFFSMGTSSVGGCTGCSCFAEVRGFFAGANAERAGISYAIHENSMENSAVGAAALKRNP